MSRSGTPMITGYSVDAKANTKGDANMGTKDSDARQEGTGRDRHATVATQCQNKNKQ